jgi:hypothetical protein
MPRRNNRQPMPELPVILPDFGATVEGLWSVTLTNNFGTKVIQVQGTKASAWDWAEVAGSRGGIAHGFWYPVEIECAARVVEPASFLALV